MWNRLDKAWGFQIARLLIDRGWDSEHLLSLLSSAGETQSFLNQLTQEGRISQRELDVVAQRSADRIREFEEQRIQCLVAREWSAEIELDLNPEESLAVTLKRNGVDTETLVYLLSGYDLSCPFCELRLCTEQVGENRNCPICGGDLVFRDEEETRAGQPSLVDNRYELEDRIGKGGMGAVYRARDIELERTVAIKFNHGRPERFLREARTMAKLHHPGIIQIHDTGEDPDRGAYIVMELLDGTPLDKLLEGGPLPVERSVEILGQAANAVHHAHQATVIHRDLKPANIMCREDGSVTVLDFGLAKAEDDVRLTKTGAVIGTPFFMAPEQLQPSKNQKPDGRTDVYALGTILYQCLTGELPFQEGISSKSELIYAILTQRPPNPKKTNPEIPSGLASVCLKALRKAPERRFQTAEEFRQALVDGAPKKKFGFRKMLIGGALSLLVAALFVLPFLLPHGKTTQNANREPAPTSPRENDENPDQGETHEKAEPEDEQAPQAKERKRLFADDFDEVRSAWRAYSESMEPYEPYIQHTGKRSKLRMGGQGHKKNAGLVLTEPTFALDRELHITADVWLTASGWHYTDIQFGLLRLPSPGALPGLFQDINQDWYTQIWLNKGNGDHAIKTAHAPSRDRRPLEVGTYQAQQWHRACIHLFPDGRARFLLDGELIARESGGDIEKADRFALALVGQSGGGPAYVDRIAVTTGPPDPREQSALVASDPEEESPLSPRVEICSLRWRDEKIRVLCVNPGEKATRINVLIDQELHRRSDNRLLSDSQLYSRQAGLARPKEPQGFGFQVKTPENDNQYMRYAVRVYSNAYPKIRKREGDKDHWFAPPGSPMSSSVLVIDPNDAHRFVIEPELEGVPHGNRFWLLSGRLNDTDLGRTNQELVVRPGEKIEGNVRLRLYNAQDKDAIVPVGWTPTWKERNETAYTPVDEWARPGATIYGIPVEVTAPKREGIHYLVFAAGPGYTIGEIMSAASGRRAKQSDWNDSDDAANLSPELCERAIEQGRFKKTAHDLPSQKWRNRAITCIRVKVKR